MMNLHFAKQYAHALVRELRPFCSKIDIAGSIRRERTEVKDIEIVLCRKNVLLYEFKTVIDKYPCYKGEATGKYTQRKIYTTPLPGDLQEVNFIVADIFMPSENDYYRQLAIRTGPAEFSHKAIAAGWKKKGWVGTPDGLRLERECIKKGDRWMCQMKQPTLPPAWDNEREFFKWIRLTYLAPEERGLVAV